MTQQRERFVGIDVSKDSLDVAVGNESQANQVGNDRKGISSNTV